MSTLSDISVPDIPPLSPGSSVSTRLQDEYDELLKFAVVVPKYDPRNGGGAGQTLTDTRESFLQKDLSSGSHDMPHRSFTDARDDDDCSEATDVTPINSRVSQDGLPDFGGHSPIRQEAENPGWASQNHRQEGENPGRSSQNYRQEGENPGRSSQNYRQEGENPGRSSQNYRQEGENPGRSSQNYRQEGENPGRSSQNYRQEGENPGRSSQNYRQEGENQGRASQNHRDFPSFQSSERHSARSDSRERYVETEQGEYEKVYTATVDPDVAKMENMMDQWCLDLKRNVLAEFSQSKIKIVEQGRHQLVREQEKHSSEKMKLVEEINSLKELLATYEKSIERKDQVISNLTNAMQKQRDKMEMTRKFCDWKIKHNDYKREEGISINHCKTCKTRWGKTCKFCDWKIKHNDYKREVFTSKLAKQHYDRRISQKAWDAWHSIIEVKWRQRVERACQTKAQEVCLQLTSEYEAKLRAANEALGEAKGEVSRMHEERDRYEEMMKKAFMRGVCALNMEAMTIFTNGEEKENQSDGDNRIPENSDNLLGSLPEKDYSTGKSLPHDALPSVSVQRHDRIVTSEGSRPTSTTQTKPQNARPKSNKKVLTTKVTSKVDTGKGKTADIHSLAPPMSSVIVERHQPVTKQTMPHAIAEKFPKQSSTTRPSSATRPSDNQRGMVHRKIAGQGPLPATTNIHTVKHVE